MTDPLLVARIKTADGRISFTDPATLAELFRAVNERLPVDKVYILLPSNGGFTLKEAGELVLQYQPVGEAIPMQAAPVIDDLTAVTDLARGTTSQASPTTTPPPTKKSRHKRKSHAISDNEVANPIQRGEVVTNGWIPGHEPPSGAPDPHSKLSGPFWKE